MRYLKRTFQECKEQFWRKNVSLWICMCWIDEIIKGLFTKVANHVPKAVLDCDSDPFPIWKPDFTLCKHKALSNQDTKKGVLDRDPPRKPDSGDLWTQSFFFRTWFVHAHFGNACWSHAWVNLRSRNKVLPYSALILFVIGTAVAMLVSAHTCTSNHKPIQEADPKQLSECHSLLFEQALYFMCAD